jgi:hypothetical protein
MGDIMSDLLNIYLNFMKKHNASKPNAAPETSMEDIAKEVFAEFGNPIEVNFYQDPDEILKIINQDKLSKGGQNE